MKIGELGYKVGSGLMGPRDSIADVIGVKVGHYTYSDPDHNTGVTVVMPCADNPYTNKLPAAFYAANGFGKSIGSIQVEELGTLETPIALTNTLNVGIVHDALVSYMLGICERDNVEIKSVNPFVGECNDYALNKISDRVITQKNVFEALENASEDFEEGSVGAGAGTSCFGLKGGIGSASRIVSIGSAKYTVGILCQTNFGRTKDFCLLGKNIGKKIEEELDTDLPDKGSCMVVMATDIPLSDRQIKRSLKRCSIGLIRTGSFLGNGSGEIFIGFSTANRLPQDEKSAPVEKIEVLNEAYMDDVFRSCAEATEEAVLNSMISSETVSSNGNTRYSLRKFLDGINNGNRY